MMWKDEGYMASGEKLVNPSLNASDHASKAFGHASKAFNKRPEKGVLCSKWHVYDKWDHIRPAS